jgi:hypothetical protein
MPGAISITSEEGLAVFVSIGNLTSCSAEGSVTWRCHRRGLDETSGPQGCGMPYRIERVALHAFVDRQLLLIESTPVPVDLAAVVGDEELGDDEMVAVWLGAGVATQIGLALLNEPERFVVPTRA